MKVLHHHNLLPRKAKAVASRRPFKVASNHGPSLINTGGGGVTHAPFIAPIPYGSGGGGDQLIGVNGHTAVCTLNSSVASHMLFRARTRNR